MTPSERMPELPDVPDDEVAALEAAVEAALRTGDDEGLHLLGNGEVTLVVGWPTDRPVVACKRLPVFADVEEARRHGDLVAEYVSTLAARGVRVVPSQWRTTDAAGGGVAGWVLQPVLEPRSLAPAALAAEPATAATVLGAVVERIHAVVDPRVGLDAQLSNWALADDGPWYLDITTPLLADAAGRTRLDLRLLTTALPTPLRPLVRRLVAPGIVAAYHRTRDVTVDLVGNLYKERLGSVVDAALSEANRRVVPAITEEEVRRWYRSNARTWEWLLWARTADRWWQRRVRRRTYPFLLPPRVER